MIIVLKQLFFRYKRGFLLYGGKLKNGQLSDELWFYNIYSKKWFLRARHSITKPLALTRHTLTYVEHTNSVYLVGGSNSKGYFSSKIFCIQINIGNIYLYYYYFFYLLFHA